MPPSDPDPAWPLGRRVRSMLLLASPLQSPGCIAAERNHKWWAIVELNH